MNRNDLVGQRFGRLQILADSSLRTRRGEIIWESVCDCGATHNACGSRLRSGNVRSCGCLRRDVSRERARLRRRKGT